MAGEFITALKASAVQPGTLVAIDVHGTAIAFANVGGTYYAFEDTCTHEQCSLKATWRARQSPVCVTARSSTYRRERSSEVTADRARDSRPQRRSMPISLSLAYASAAQSVE